MLKKNVVIIDDSSPGINKKVTSINKVHEIIKQRPNKKMIGLIPFHLWIYNLSNPKKTNWLNTYLRKIGEAPVTLDSLLTQKSVLQIKSHFENNGYFKSKVNSEIIYKKNRSHVKYRIKTGNLYFINHINYIDNNHAIHTLIQDNMQDSEIKTGDVFTYNGLNNERIRIEKLLKDNGFYKFIKEYIYIKADSTTNNLVDINF